MSLGCMFGTYLLSQMARLRVLSEKPQVPLRMAAPLHILSLSAGRFLWVHMLKARPLVSTSSPFFDGDVEAQRGHQTAPGSL